MDAKEKTRKKGVKEEEAKRKKEGKASSDSVSQSHRDEHENDDDDDDHHVSPASGFLHTISSSGSKAIWSCERMEWKVVVVAMRRKIFCRNETTGSE